MATCGECKNFIRVDNTACGRCRSRKYLMSRQKRETNREFRPHRSRTACKQFYAEGTTITNYDRIKAMSVEEMANFLSEAEWKAMQGKSKYPHEWEQWLKKEVSENDI